MRGVFSRSRCAAAAWLLILILLAPNAFATNTPPDPGLWAEFVAWVDAGFGEPSGVTAADEDSFTVWLMGHIGIPGG
jgi:hypothetical protein